MIINKVYYAVKRLTGLRRSHKHPIRDIQYIHILFGVYLIISK